MKICAPLSRSRLTFGFSLASEPNADHARSPLFRLTERGAACYARLAETQRDWVDALVADVPLAELQAASRVLRTLSQRLTTGTTRKATA